MEFDYKIWIHHEKCIQISTNMPSIDTAICETGCEIFIFERRRTPLVWNSNGRMRRGATLKLHIRSSYSKESIMQ